jgi:hypothetical protein
MTIVKARDPLTKRFLGSTRDGAVEAARTWSKDLNSHGPVDVESISTMQKGEGKFFATVTYRE